MLLLLLGRNIVVPLLTRKARARLPRPLLQPAGARLAGELPVPVPVALHLVGPMGSVGLLPLLLVGLEDKSQALVLAQLLL